MTNVVDNIKVITKKYKKLFFYALVFASFCVCYAIFANYYISSKYEKYIYESIDKLPSNKVGLLLGASKKTKGKPNEYFVKRIKAAAELYKKGKVRYILVSGDNHKYSYNEPVDMKYALIFQGVPDSVIVMDYAGFRTYDSVVRALKVFGQNSLTIISQDFHNQRAVFIAREIGIDAVGFNAESVDGAKSIIMSAREVLSKSFALIDVITNNSPHFLGAPIQIGKD
jgi:SanA protein